MSEVIRTYAGTGICNFAGDGRDRTETHLSSPAGLAVSLYGGDVFVSESGGRIRRFTQAGAVTSAVYTSTLPILQSPSGISLSSDLANTLAIADTTANRLFSLSSSSTDNAAVDGGLQTLVGTGIPGDIIDGPGNETDLRQPIGMASAVFSFQGRYDSYLLFSDAGASGV